MLMIESDMPGGPAADQLALAEEVCARLAATTTVQGGPTTAGEADWLRQGGGWRFGRSSVWATRAWRTSAPREPAYPS